MSDLSQAHTAAKASEIALLAAFRAFMRQPGGPDQHGMCRVLDNMTEEFRVLTGGYSNDWQNTIAERIKESSDELAGELAEAPEVFPGVRAQLDALTMWKSERDNQRARHCAAAPF